MSMQNWWSWRAMSLGFDILNPFCFPNIPKEHSPKKSLFGTLILWFVLLNMEVINENWENFLDFYFFLQQWMYGTCTDCHRHKFALCTKWRCEIPSCVCDPNKPLGCLHSWVHHLCILTAIINSVSNLRLLRHPCCDLRGHELAIGSCGILDSCTETIAWAWRMAVADPLVSALAESLFNCPHPVRAIHLPCQSNP